MIFIINQSFFTPPPTNSEKDNVKSPLFSVVCYIAPNNCKLPHRINSEINSIIFNENLLTFMYCCIV